MLRTDIIPRIIERLDLSVEDSFYLVATITSDARASDVREMRARLAESAAEEDLSDDVMRRLRSWNVKFTPAGTRAAAVDADTGLLASETTRLITDAWGRLPASTRQRIGTKADFVRVVEEIVLPSLEELVVVETAKSEIDAVLRSRIDVLVRGEEIQDPNRLQSVTITMRGADIETLVDGPMR